MGKRKFTSEFKTKLVLEALREERELSAIAAEHEISPNQLRNWKNSFLEKAPGVFDESRQERDRKRQEKEATEEKDALLKTIGQLLLERDFLQKQVSKQGGKYFFR